jgi:hypothetical protein
MNTRTKELIPNQSWIVQSDGEKIGTLYKKPSGYILYQNGLEIHLGKKPVLQSGVVITIDKPTKKDSVKTTEKTVYGVPCDCEPHNQLYNVRHQVPVYTKTIDSKCQYCAGYYVILDNGQYKIEFCPKYIRIQRHTFYGPFDSHDQSHEFLKSIINETNKHNSN